MVQSRATGKNALHDLGYKIFLDRYAQKDMTRTTLAVGDIVIVVVDSKTGQREVGTVKAMELPTVTIELLDGSIVTRDLEHVDKPLETDPGQMMDRVAAGIAKVETEPVRQREWTEKFRWLLDGWKFVPGGRILTGAGTDQKLTYYNCYVVPSPKDSREGIIETLRQMTEIMSRGGGVGINISTLRPRHAYVKGVNGRSSGSVSWGALYSFVTGLIEQGGSRRGALMLILNDWHPDVFDFINSKRKAGNITNANISVGVSDKFMDAVNADGDWDLIFPDTSDPEYNDLWDGDIETWMAMGRKVQHYRTVKAREVWDAIIESAWASAEPGVWFRERSNKMSNSWYYNPLIATNPCHAGDNLIHTRDGLIPIKDLVGKEFEVVSDLRTLESTGVHYEKAIAYPTGRGQLYEVRLANGQTIELTANHKVFTARGKVAVGNLKVGEDAVLIQSAPHQDALLTHDEDALAEGRIVGWNAGLSGGAIFAVEEAAAAVGAAATVSMTSNARSNVAALPRDHDIVNTPVAFRIGFLQGLFSAKGVVTDPAVELVTVDAELAKGVQMLLADLGITTNLDAVHTVTINGGESLRRFARLVGLPMAVEKQTQLNAVSTNTAGETESYTSTVVSVTPTRFEDIYNVTTEDSHSLIANGFVVANCGEQSLGAFSVCNLGAINLAKFYDPAQHDVQWEDLRDTVRYSVRFLDNIIDSTPYFFEENAIVQGRERRIGLGTMGIAELMIRLGIRYGSDESIQFIDRIYGFITTEAYRMSSEIAAEKGAFPAFDAEKFLESGFMLTMGEDVRQQIARNGIRNVTLVTQAPTGTTGTMVNTSTGIEPFFSWVYYRKSRLGLHEEQVPIVQEWHNAHPSETELPDYFVTAMELTPEEHVRVQAAFQRWIDSSISKTANVPNHYTVEQVSELYKYMYELGCKGGTIYRDGSRDEQVLMLKTEEKEKPAAETKKSEAPITVEARQPEKVAQTTTPHRVYPRPDKLQGVTVGCSTPFGTAYITMNSDEHGYPFEVFITAPGKAGSDLQADAEGLGRMISLSLRTTDPHNRREMLKLIIDQLRDIGGARSIGFGQNRVISLPDSVARAMEEHYFPKNEPQQLGLPIVTVDAAVKASAPSLVQPVPAPQLGAPEAEFITQNGTISGADMCPSCATISLVRVEGCRKCLTCGYSEC